MTSSTSWSPAVGLSVGSTTLAAVTADHAVTVRPMVVRAGHPVGGFVDRVGDPVGIVAADGSLHPAAALLADALRDLARSANAGRGATVAVAYPGHWRPAEVEALRRALRRIPHWQEPTLLPDYEAALRALRVDLPERGVVAVCDFGGTATTVTLVDLGTARLIGTPRQNTDFSGDAIDRALLNHVLASAGVAPGSTGTSAIAPLTRLRGECRAAKERLSAQTATTVPGRTAGLRSDVRITRPELEELLRAPLAAVPADVQELMRHNAIAKLAAVVSTGGGAAIPAVTTVLSQNLWVPVIAARRPALTAAAGAALAGSGRVQESATVIVPAGTHQVPAALAWSEAALPEFVPLKAERAASRRPPAAARPRLTFAPETGPTVPPAAPWRRQPIFLAAAVLAVIAGAGGATALALRSEPAAAAPATAPSPAGVPAVSDAVPADPAPRTVVAVPGISEVPQLFPPSPDSG